jgi:hypothetical protein
VVTEKTEATEATEAAGETETAEGKLLPRGYA